MIPTVKKVVLVVDDEQAILHFLTIKLRISGYEMVATSDGEEALDLVCSVCPDVMLEVVPEIWTGS
jgi:two-component system KDP operon response regulator KdpE